MIYEVIIDDAKHYVDAESDLSAILVAYRLYVELIIITYTRYPFDTSYVDNVLSKVETVNDLLEIIQEQITFKQI